jgi:hypothetical protein
MNKAGKGEGRCFTAIAPPDPRGSGPDLRTLLAMPALPGCDDRTGGIEADRGGSFR